MTKKNNSVLVISDLHMPYHHTDTIGFLRAIKRKYKPDRIILTGDECDKHALSFHNSDVDLFSAGDELKETVKYLKVLYDIFPKADVMESNHGSLHLRKAKANGIPIHYIKSYHDILEAPKTWVWHEDLVIKLSNGQDCYFSHGQMGKAPVVSKAMSMNCVQGHRHSDFLIDYWSNPKDLFWAMSVGCMIDDHSLAMAYNKFTPRRPIIGHGIIIDGLPKLLPMIIGKNHRWNGFVP